MKRSNELLGRLGDLYADIETAVYKLIKKDGKKHLESVSTFELGSGCSVDVYKGEVNGVQTINIRCTRLGGADVIEKPMRMYNVDTQMNILESLENAYGIDD